MNILVKYLKKEAMLRISIRNIFIMGLVTSFLLLIIRPCKAQTIGRVCDGTQFPGGTFIPRGQERIVTYGGKKYRCIGCGSCIPLTTGQAPSYTSKTYNYSPKNFTQSLMMGLMQSFINGFMQGLQSYRPPSPKRDYEIKKQQEEQKLKEEKWLAEWKQQITKQIDEMREQYRMLKEEEFKASKARLLSKVKGVDSVDASKSQKQNIAMDNLKCSYYLSKKALEEKDIEVARQYSSDAALAMTGEISCPENIELPEAPTTLSYDTQFRDEFFSAYVMELNNRVDAALRLRKELDEASKKLKESEEKVKQLEIKKEISGGNEKAQIDSLLEEAKKALKDATEQEKRASEDFENVNKEINALKEIEKIFLSVEAKK